MELIEKQMTKQKDSKSFFQIMKPNKAGDMIAQELDIEFDDDLNN